GQNFREVGLHQCPSERKGEGVPVRSLRVPSHVPSQPQTAAKVRGFSPIASGFTAETDWLLEQRRFELSVPPLNAAFRGRATWVRHRSRFRSCALLRSAMFYGGLRRGNRLILLRLPHPIRMQCLVFH